MLVWRLTLYQKREVIALFICKLPKIKDFKEKMGSKFDTTEKIKSGKNMKLLNYDFYDLYALLIFFRMDTDKISEYAKTIEELITCLENPAFNNGTDCNIVRKILQKHVSKEEKGLFWIWTENIYTGNTITMKNTSHYCILAEIFREMLCNLGDNQRLWRLCDATHNIPTLLVECKEPKKAIKTMIRIYQMEYNKEFLVEELKVLIK